MRLKRLYRAIARRTGYDVKDVERLLPLFFSRYGIRYSITKGQGVRLIGFAKFTPLWDKIYKRNLRRIKGKKLTLKKRKIWFDNHKEYMREYWKNYNINRREHKREYWKNYYINKKLKNQK